MGTEKKFTINEPEFQFGYDVAIDGNTLVITDSASGNGGAKGAVYIYRRSEVTNTWGQVKKLVSENRYSSNFGSSVAVSGNTLVVGDYGADSYKGSVYVFQKDEGGINNWGRVKKLAASDGNRLEFFGISVTISGQTLAVGASRHSHDPIRRDSLGAVYIFDQNQGGINNWGEVKEIVPTRGIRYFGEDLDLSGNNLAVNGITLSGKFVYLHERNYQGTNTWGRAKRLDASDDVPEDSFGYSIAIDGSTIVASNIPAPQGSVTYQGSVYVFYD